MLQLALRTWPYFRPMLKHLMVLGGLMLSGIVAGIPAAFVGTDLFYNKVLIGQKLQPAVPMIRVFAQAHICPH